MKEIQDKISKLEVVVNSKMIPDSVKAKAKAEIEKLKEELKETKVEEKAEKPKKEAKSKVVGNDLKVIKFFDLTESDWNKMALNERNELSDSYKEKMKAEKKEPKEKAESKKAELTEKECNELLEKYKAEREARKERAEKREKQGKPAELTPAETAKKAVDRVTDKIEAKAEKGKSVKGDIKAVFNQFKSAVAELKKYKDEIDQDEVRNLIKELESLLTKKMATGGGVFNPMSSTFYVKDNNGKILLKTKSLNKASDFITINGKNLSIIAIDENGNKKTIN